MKTNILLHEHGPRSLGRESEEELLPKGPVGMLAAIEEVIWGRHYGGKDI